MLLSKNPFLARAVASLAFFLSQVSAQCNPLTATCPPNLGLTKSDYYVDFTKQSSLPEDWILANYATVKYGVNGAEFTFSKRHDAPYIWTNFYILFGRVEVVMQAAPGTGIVSSAVLMSDDQDEIDWEWSGNNFASGSGKVQTNYFGKGITGNYDRGTQPAVDSPQTKFHTYTLDWTPNTLAWSIDGQLIHTLKAADCDKGAHQYPQSPSRLHLGLWDAGDADVHPATANWAGGYTDLTKAPFTAYVKSVRITNTNPCSEYTYGDKSGNWQSIKCTNTTLSSSSSSSSSTASSSISAISLESLSSSVANGSASSTSSSAGLSSAGSLSSMSSLPPSSSDPAPSTISPTSGVKSLSISTTSTSSSNRLSGPTFSAQETSTNASTSVSSSACTMPPAPPTSFTSSSSTKQFVAPSFSNGLSSNTGGQVMTSDTPESPSSSPTRKPTLSTSGERPQDASTTSLSSCTTIVTTVTAITTITTTIITITPSISGSNFKPSPSATESTTTSMTLTASKPLYATSSFLSSTSNTAKTTTTSLKCNLDNCLRNLQDTRHATSATALCKTYTAPGDTATADAAAGATPAAIPTWLSGCSRSAARVSSACTCLMADLPTATSSGSATTMEAATAAPTGTAILGRAAVLTQTDGNDGGEDEDQADGSGRATADDGSDGDGDDRDESKVSGYGSNRSRTKHGKAHAWLHRRRGDWLGW